MMAGVFPPPTRTPGRRPHYPAGLIRRCLDIRRTGVGENGVVMFNRRGMEEPIADRVPLFSQATEDVQQGLLRGASLAPKPDD
ncbi:unnamed protein product [Gemmata massiliana]|uniref:Uncharacterized protein n=1 Tax=Gemmata massiliana TaxID=1210884 RepID=A0A6P2D3B4_9BACT|nr:unnamed protein product [Gemmata massiliana]